MKKPTTDTKKILGIFFFSIGVILFLITLHIMVLSETGYVNSTLMTAFTLSLRLFIMLGTLSFVLLIIYLLRILAYFATTPKWLQEEHKEEENG